VTELVLWIISGVIIIWLAVIIIRAVMLKPDQGQGCPLPNLEPIRVDSSKVAERLAAMVRCKTIAPESAGKGGEEESGYNDFIKLRSLIKEYYPLTHEQLDYEIVNDHSLLYRWPGRNSDKPMLLMAHYDVVPADERQWSKPPFDGIIEDGVLWGRGSIDTKVTFCAIFEAAEALLATGFKPVQDIYFAFGHDEETMGSGAPAIVEVLKERGIRPAMVLDEGGAIVHNIFPGVKEPIAVVGMAEKGVTDIEFILEGPGGHSSTPGRVNPMGVISRIILQVDKNPFRAHLPVEVREMFSVLGRHMPFAFRVIFANLWCFKPLLLALLPLIGRELNALCRTTCVFTIAEASSASNVIPERVRVVANLRLAAIDPIESALKHLTDQAMAASKKAREGSDPLKLSVSVIKGHNASPSSSTASNAYRKLAGTVESVFRGTIVTPYIMLGASDSRHFCAISDNVLRFSPIQLCKEELRSIHGIDEKLAVEKVGKVVEFYTTLITKP
jgi:carboxypeptidase PM20D1